MIDIENMTFYYGKKLGLQMEKATFDLGKVYGIVGRNGAGKTTFFKLLTNMLTNYSGTIKIFGKNVREETSVLKDVSIVLDDLEVYKDRTGLFNIEYFSRLHGHYNEVRARKIALEIGIGENLNDRVKTYSLGMRRKLILLIALLNDSSIYIFDEPFRGLDEEAVSWMKAYFLELKHQGKLIFISSHVKKDIENLVDEALVIESGKIKAQVNLSDITEDSRKISVQNKEDFRAFLLQENLSFTEKVDFFTVALEDNDWQDFLKKMVKEGILVEEIKKVSALDLLQVENMKKGGVSK